MLQVAKDSSKACCLTCRTSRRSQRFLGRNALSAVRRSATCFPPSFAPTVPNETQSFARPILIMARPVRNRPSDGDALLDHKLDRERCDRRACAEQDLTPICLPDGWHVGGLCDRCWDVPVSFKPSFPRPVRHLLTRFPVRGIFAKSYAGVDCPSKTCSVFNDSTIIN